jgi:hypothetical protein
MQTNNITVVDFTQRNGEHMHNRNMSILPPHQRPDAGSYMPSAEQIRTACERIQAGWSKTIERHRRQWGRQSWNVPVVRCEVESQPEQRLPTGPPKWQAIWAKKSPLGEREGATGEWEGEANPESRGGQRGWSGSIRMTIGCANLISISPRRKSARHGTRTNIGSGAAIRMPDGVRPRPASM